ncbi:MAG: hypothetical protein GEV00_21005 [Actinophytocola sp.]|nr:hypothetical protein [Actinophytocola sp.]
MDTTYTLTVEGMHCGSCPLLINDVLEDLPGVLASETSLKTGTSTVTVNPAECTPEDALTAISELGYTARHQA